MKFTTIIFSCFVLALLVYVPNFGFQISSAAKLTCNSGNTPGAIAFDPQNNRTYVADIATTSISVIKTPCNVVGSVLGPTATRAMGFNPLNGRMYVVNQYSIIMIKNLQIVRNITVSRSNILNGIAFDPSNGLIFVANETFESVTLINGSKIVGGIPGPGQPLQIAYAPTTGNMYVTATFKNTVFEIGSSCLCVLKSVVVSKTPSGVAFNPINGMLYVAESGDQNDKGNTVLVFDPQTMGIVATITVGFVPLPIAFSPTTSDIYVGNKINKTISVISDLSVVKTIRISGGIAALAYNPIDGMIYATDPTLNTTFIIR